MEPWRILVVDDVEEVAEQVAEVIRTDPGRVSPVPVIVEVETDFGKAIRLIDSKRVDLLVLDVRDQGTAEDQGDTASPGADGTDVTDADMGLEVFRRVRAARFVPVVFHTGLPNLVDKSKIRPPFVQLVSKSASNSTAEIRNAVNTVLDSSLPAIHRALNTHVEVVIRDFMVEFVEKHWSQLQSPKRRGDLAHLLLRRLALSLADDGKVLGSLLSDETDVQLSDENVHPMRFYVMPPVGDFTTGDLIHTVDGHSPPATSESQAAIAADSNKGTTRGELVDLSPSSRWYVVLTPACDLVPARLKADFVVLVECVALESTPEYREWISTRPAEGEEPSSKANKAGRALAGLMRNRRHDRPADRDYFLPAAWSVPNLMVDFQRMLSAPVDELATKYVRVATIDSPYVEALVETFSRYLGRRGTPDLDTSLVITQITATPTGGAGLPTPHVTISDSKL